MGREGTNEGCGQDDEEGGEDVGKRCHPEWYRTAVRTEVVCSMVGRLLSWHYHFVVFMVVVWRSEVLLYELGPQSTTYCCEKRVWK